MLNENQRSKVQNYLLNKSLPLDIMMEVEDHFNSQISELIVNGRSFEQAFEETKLAWLPELIILRSGTAAIASKLYRKIYYDAVRTAILLAFSFTSLLFPLAKLLSLDIFRSVFTLVIAGLMLFPALYYAVNFSTFQLVKNYRKSKLTGLQNINILVLVSVFQLLTISINGDNLMKPLYQILNFQETDILYVSIVPLIAVEGFLLFYCFFMQSAYLRQIKKAQPFLTNS